MYICSSIYSLWGLFSDARAQSRTFGRGVRLHFDLCFAVASRCSRLLGQASECGDPCRVVDCAAGRRVVSVVSVVLPCLGKD